jgi:TolA-binding protein
MQKKAKELRLFKRVGVILFSLMIASNFSAWSQNNPSGFTQKDRELLIELKATVSQMEKRITELREDMNKRFEQVDKRFEQVDKRFEQADSRSNQMMSFIWILATIFGCMTAATIGFAIWDRRTMIRPFEEKVKGLEKTININNINAKPDYNNIVAVLKEYAAKNKQFAGILQRYNL